VIFQDKELTINSIKPMPNQDKGKSNLQANDPKKTLRVLIVDDSPEDRAELRRLLLNGSDRRYEFFEAETGADCLKACLESVGNLPDCVLLDYNLPDYDAPELLMALGGVDSPCCPIVVVTGSTQRIHSVDILSLGAQDFISKNWVNPESLTRSLENSIERFRLNRELKYNNKRFMAFLENSAVTAWMKDEQGTYTYLSENCAKRFNIQPKDWLGKTDFDLWPKEIAEQIHHNDRAVLSENCAVEYVEQARNPDGGICWWLVSKFPFEDYDGKWFIGGLGVDVTERKLAEQALMDSESRMRLATETTGVGIWEWNVLTNELKWDAEIFRIYGVTPTPDGIVDFNTWRDGVLPEDLPEQEKVLQESILNDVINTREFRIRRANDGECRYIQGVEISRRNGNGQVEWVVGTNFDITDSKIANAKLKAAFDEKEVLLKEVYHRVKNNLQVVSSLINLQSRTVKNEEALKLLKQSADRIKAMALIHEKLYQSNDLVKIDFNSYIGNLADSLLYSFGIPLGQVKISLDINDIFLDIDRAIPCGLIVNELISNALKHAFPKGQRGNLDIRFNHDENEYKLMISDNGIGLPDGLNIKTSQSLGLQLVSGLVVNQLKGSISVQQNNGALFAIHFPMNDHETS
jgi:PAS domain S-box-containing protein